MPTTITEAFVNQFNANIHVLAQQKASRLEATVDVESGIVGESKAVERIGSTDATQRVTRNADTKLLDVEHSKRWIDLSDYDWATLLDQPDKIKMLIDPTSQYSVAALAAMNRAKDSVIISALGGSARSTKAGTGSVALPSGQKIAHGGAGLTLAKLTQAKQLLDEAEVDEDEPRFCVITAEQLNNLLNVTEVKSADYNSVKALVKGEIDTYLGFKFIRSERLPKASTTRYCYAYAKTGVQLGIGQDVKARISERADKNYAVQVYAAMSLGAVRVEEARVVEIACTEAA